jgi:hydroxymethylbilane synthase
LGTRRSALARWQADWVAERLERLGVPIQLVPVSTQGDVTSGPLRAIGGQGLFTREIQAALLDGRIDLAVHSLKDLPTETVAGLTLAAVPPREDPHDVLVATGAAGLEGLPPAARVGTGSARRRAQLLHARPDLNVQDLRGNVDTRLRKLDEGQFDALVLAAAGLLRLGLQDRITQVLPASIVLPAVGQGALGIEARADDHELLERIAPLDDFQARAGVTAERELLTQLRGGCLAPVAAWARPVPGGRLQLDAIVLSADGTQRIASRQSGPPQQARMLGAQAARELLAQGAAELIAAARGG